MTCYRGEYLPNHPTFPEGSAAVCQEHTIPVPINAPDIHYTSTDDEAIKAHVRASGEFQQTQFSVLFILRDSSSRSILGMAFSKF